MCSWLGLSGRCPGTDAVCPRREAEGLRLSSVGSHLYSALQGFHQPSKENISTSTLVVYLSSYKAPRSASPRPPAPQALQGPPRSVERRASCPTAQGGASSYHGNEESAASSPVTLVMVHRESSVVAAAHLGHIHFLGGFVGNTGTITGQGALEEIQLGIS